MEVLVQQAETGRSFSVALQAGDSVPVLKALLIPMTSIAASHQILLHDGDQLKDEHTLSEHGLPARDPRAKPVFLFNRSTLSQRAEPPEWRPIAAHELLVPESISPEQLLRQNVGDMASPLVRALLDYERSFCLHLAQGSAVHECGAARIAAAAASASEQNVQGAALNSAVANLRGFSQELSKRYAAFQARYNETISLQTELARSFEVDIQVLRAVKIEPAVCKLEGWSEGATLLDTLGETELRHWLGDYQEHVDHLMAKAAQFTLQWAELSGAVQQEEEEPVLASPGATEEVVRGMESPHSEMKQLLAELRRDADGVRILVDDQVLPSAMEGETASSDGSMRTSARRNATKLLEDVGELEKINERHVEFVLPQMKSLDSQLKCSQERAAELKMRQQLHVYHRLRSISMRQAHISQAFNKLNLYMTLMDRIETFSSKFLLMRRLPQTYRACLKEVMRRNSFDGTYSTQAHEAAERMATAREAEVLLRDQFMRESGIFLPARLSALSNLLQARPPYFEVSSSSSDNTLSQLSQALHASVGPLQNFSLSQAAVLEAARPAEGGAEEPCSSARCAKADGPSMITEHQAALGPAASTMGACCPSTVAIDMPENWAGQLSGAAGLCNTSTDQAGRSVEGDAPDATRDVVTEETRASGASVVNAPGATACNAFEGRGTPGDMLPMRRIHSTPAHVGLWPGPFAAALHSDNSPAHSSRVGAVLAGRMPSELSELSSALEALGTPLDGVPVEVASELQQRLAAQEATSFQLRRQRDSQDAELEATKARLLEALQRSDELSSQLEAMRQQLAESALASPDVFKDASTSPEATPRATNSSSPPSVHLSVSVRPKADEDELCALLSPLQSEVSTIEVAMLDLINEQEALLQGVRIAMSCLPPPAAEGSTASASDAGTLTLVSDTTKFDQLVKDLCSSARQAAHANARLGHAMASEREHRKGAATAAERRISYLAADNNSRLLFSAQPSRHAPRSNGLAFGAVLLPTLPSGLPTHWLSRESEESLCRCYVVGRVVHVSGPLTASNSSSNPYNLPLGETYYVVHAEIMLQHRWIASQA